MPPLLLEVNFHLVNKLLLAFETALWKIKNTDSKLITVAKQIQKYFARFKTSQSCLHSLFCFKMSILQTYKVLRTQTENLLKKSIYFFMNSRRHLILHRVLKRLIRYIAHPVENFYLFHKHYNMNFCSKTIYSNFSNKITKN